MGICDCEAYHKCDLERFCMVEPYELRHAASHLYEAGQKERLYQLLLGNGAWMDTKFERLGTDLFYVDDLELASQDLVDPLTSDQLLSLVQLCTARQVVDTRTNMYAYWDLQTLVFLGRGQQAQYYAELRADPQSKFDSLYAIYAAYFQKGVHNERLLEEVISIAQSIVDPEQKASALSIISIELCRLGQKERALSVLQDIGEEEAFLKARIGTVEALAELCRIDEALSLAATIANPKAKAAALATIAVLLIRSGDHRSTSVIDRILETPQELDGANRDFAQMRAVSILAGGGCVEQAKSVMKRFVTWEYDDGRALFRDQAKANLAFALARKARYEEMELILGEIGGVFSDWVATALPAAITTGGDLDKALTIARCSQEPNQSRALNEVVLILAEKGQYENAIQILQEISTRDTLLLNKVAYYLAKSGDILHAEEVLGEALQRNQLNYLVWSLSLMRGDLAAAISVAGNFDDGIRLASSIRAHVGHSTFLGKPTRSWESLTMDKHERTSSLTTIATAVACTGQLDRALAIVRQIHGRGAKESRAKARLRISTALALRGEFDQALALAQKITCLEVRVQALGRIAQILAKKSDNRSGAILQKAFSLTFKITMPTRRSLVLVELVSMLPPPTNVNAEQILAEAMAEIRRLRPAQKRAYRLWEVSSALAQAGDKRAGILFDEMLASIEQIKSTYTRESSLEAVADALARAGNCRANEILRSMTRKTHSNIDFVKEKLKEAYHERGDLRSVESKLWRKLWKGLSEGQGRRVSSVFEEIMHKALETDDESTLDWNLRDIMYVAAIVGNGIADRAVDSLLSLSEDPAILGGLCETLAEAGDARAGIVNDKLMKSEYGFQSNSLRSDVDGRNNYPMVVAERGAIANALRLVDLRRHPFEFLGILADWILVFEEVEQGLSKTVLGEAFRIAEWIVPNRYEAITYAGVFDNPKGDI